MESFWAWMRLPRVSWVQPRWTLYIQALYFIRKQGVYLQRRTLETRILNLTERSCLLWFCPIIWLCKQWVCNFDKDINNDRKWLVLLDSLCQILPILILGSWWNFCLPCEITYQNSRINDACIIISVTQLLPHSLWDQFQSLIIIMVIGYASLFPYALIRPFLTLFAISRPSGILLREVSWLCKSLRIL